MLIQINLLMSYTQKLKGLEHAMKFFLCFCLKTAMQFKKTKKQKGS